MNKIQRATRLLKGAERAIAERDMEIALLNSALDTKDAEIDTLRVQLESVGSENDTLRAEFASCVPRVVDRPTPDRARANRVMGHHTLNAGELGACRWWWESLPLGPVGRVAELCYIHRTTYRNKPDAFWLGALAEEVGELASSLNSRHEHEPELELAQIAAICINWLRLRSQRQAALRLAEGDDE